MGQEVSGLLWWGCSEFTHSSLSIWLLSSVASSIVSAFTQELDAVPLDNVKEMFMLTTHLGSWQALRWLFPRPSFRNLRSQGNHCYIVKASFSAFVRGKAFVSFRKCAVSVNSLALHEGGDCQIEAGRVHDPKELVTPRSRSPR